MDTHLQEIIDQAELEMQEAIEYVRREFNGIRAGKATPALLDGLKVNYYGSLTPINQVATVTAPDARLLTVQPYEKNLIQEIEKAIITSNLGLNPANDGYLIRIPLPMLSEERRKDLVKLCGDFAEKARVSIRNTRRDAKDSIKKKTKDESISEDFKFEAEEELQKLTDTYSTEVDQILAKKEKEILTV